MTELYLSLAAASCYGCIFHSAGSSFCVRPKGISPCTQVFEKSLQYYSSLDLSMTSFRIQGDPIPLPSPAMSPCVSSVTSIGAQHSLAGLHCEASSGMKTSSIYRALKLDESFQRAFWKGSHLAALKVYKGKQACCLAL